MWKMLLELEYHLCMQKKKKSKKIKRKFFKILETPNRKPPFKMATKCQKNCKSYLFRHNLDTKMRRVNAVSRYNTCKTIRGNTI